MSSSKTRKLRSIEYVENDFTNVIDILKADHRKVKNLFREFQKQDDRRERRRITDEIVKELCIHAAVEEEFVYPLLLSEIEDDAMEAIEEHHVMETMIADIADAGITEEALKAEMKVLKEMVFHHIKEEEWRLLPMLKLIGVDLDEVGRTVMAEKRKLAKPAMRNAS